MNIEQQIHACAAKGMSKAATCEHLGVSLKTMRNMLSVMPRVKWPHPLPEGQPPEVMARARQARLDKLTHTVQGVKGTITELARHFGIITPSAARKRVHSGQMTVEQAVTTAPRPNIYHQRKGKKA